MTAESDIEDVVKRQSTERDDLIHLSTGVVLKAKPANIVAIIHVMAMHPQPPIPMWKDPKIGRMMENPDDPEYKNRMSAWKVEQNDAVLTVFILDGTECYSKPDNIPGHMPIVTTVRKKGAKEEIVTSDPFIDKYS